MAPPSGAHLESVISDVFLPVKLPSRSQGRGHEDYLVDCVLTALKDFRSCVGEDMREAICAATQMILNFKRTRTDFGGVDQDRLQKLFSELAKDDSFVIPLHVKAQNAGIVIRRTDKTAVFEVFQLTPPNQTVLAAVGRLRRCFPSLGVAVTPKIFTSLDFQATSAATISKMSEQHVSETASGHAYPDDESINPTLVTDLLSSFLLSNGKSSPGKVIWKNTREEVNLSDGKSRPWKRSAVWLLLRVSLQQIMSPTLKGTQSDGIYKRWMIFHLAQLLREATAARLASELIACMSGKLARRLVKLDLKEHEHWMSQVSEHLRNATELLESRWHKTIEAHTQLLGFTRLAAPDVEADTRFNLPELDYFLASIADRQLVDKRLLFCPKSHLLSCSAGELPAIDSIKGSSKYEVHNLYAFEEWVSEHLDGWAQRNAKNPQACSKIESAIRKYFEIAQLVYKDSAEGISAMLLTLLDLWIACDKTACSIHPLLSRYDHEVPTGPFESLLLRFKSDMERLFRAERYLKARSNNDRCFSVEFAADSPEHQGILDRILEQAEERRNRKRQEFEQLRSLYNSHMEQYATTSCAQHNGLDEDSDPSHSQTCDRCLHKAEAGRLQIEAYEWPLPSSKAETWSVVFELAVPPSFRAWRDASIHFLSDVLGYQSRRLVDARAQCALHTFEGLSDHYKPSSLDQRVKVASETKPQTASRQRIQIGSDVTVDDICVANEMHWRLFDTSAAAFLGQFKATANVSKKCTIQLPPPSGSLQNFLCRSAFQGQGPRPNVVIAQQSACPEKMSIGEYKALCALPFGYRTQWMNILVQLAMPSVD
ncbi:hypothetical protein HRG_003996 [Hirsutella rhossiliensis]|uniref:DUF6606 domain-containing protein n=1 Tax=Hirsutella rhossiliensis TaxID=111463 RepID=A0A9P8N357_9HYPO|nr:uncharacterized protein HRG_03996 [Hirsutella rhossiliensis]KAH0965980.1 hypothetical protein HRG_03996 [Hirsutella rhossiliensis]